MNILIPKYWDSFKEIRADGKKYFNGIRFEELVREILTQNFEGSWDSTPITWDGGKDFVDRSIIGKEAWAECKMYEKSVSINKISNSLVMAINNQSVNQILFFSYSQLNRNALCHLSSFAAATSIKIQVFDDEKLELLILRDKSTTKKFFNIPPTFKMPYQKEKLSLYTFFTTSTHVEYAQLKDIDGIRKNRIPYILANTPCLYEIFIVSNDFEHTNELKVHLSEIRNNIEALGILNLQKFDLDNNGNYNKFILPGQAHSLRLYLAPTKKGNVVIPPIRIDFNNSTKELPPINITVSNLNRPSLIGIKVYESLNHFHKIISSSSIVISTVITGKTGVGKSRFLEEAHTRLLSQNFTTLHFDGNSDLCKNFSAFSSNLLSQIWRLPNTYVLKNADDIIINSDVKNTLYDRVYKILFDSDPKQNHLVEIFELVTLGFCKQRMAIIVDNVQALDALSLELLKKLNRELCGQIGENVILLSFNEDELIYSYEATVFHEDLKRNSFSETNDYFHFIELEEFSKNDVELYINTICSSISIDETFTEHYPEVTKLILENVLPRPLDLYQLFLAAHDKEIAILQDGYFLVNKIDDLHELIKSIQGKTKKIFEQRLLSLKGNQNFLKVLLSLSNLGEVYSAILEKVSRVNKKTIQFLVNGGWLKYTNNNKINFFHPAIDRYITKIIAGEGKTELAFLFPSEIRKEVTENLIVNGFKSDYSLATFYLSETKSIPYFIPAIKELKKIIDIVPNPRVAMHTSALFDYIVTTKHLAPELFLDCCEALCRLSSENNLIDFTERLITLKNRLSKFEPKTDDEACLLYSLIRQCASYNEIPEQGNLILKEGLKRIENLDKSITPNTKLKIKVNLLDRQCVCLKNMGYNIQAYRAGMLAYKIANDNKIYDFACLSLMDIAILYGDHIVNKNKYFQFLNKTILYFEEHKNEIDEFSIELEYIENKAIIESFLSKYNSAVSLIEKAIKICRQKNYISGLLRCLNLKIIFLFQKLLLEEKSQLLNVSLKSLINEIDDLSIKTRNRKFYITALQFHAIYYCIMQDNFKAFNLYQDALNNVKELTASISMQRLSPSINTLIYNASNFWVKNEIPNKFPMDRIFLERFNLSEINENLLIKKISEPLMPFSAGGFNFPLY